MVGVIRSRICLPFASPLVYPLFCEVRVAHFLSFLCCVDCFCVFVFVIFFSLFVFVFDFCLFLFCVVCLLCATVASVSGLSIFDCPLAFLSRLFSNIIYFLNDYVLTVPKIEHANQYELLPDNVNRKLVDVYIYLYCVVFFCFCFFGVFFLFLFVYLFFFCFFFHCLTKY